MTPIEIAAQIARLSAQLVSTVTEEDADVDIALALAHLATAAKQQGDAVDVLADRAGNTDGAAWGTVRTDAHSAACFLGVVAARLTAAQAAAAVGQEELAREVSAAHIVQPVQAVSSDPDLIARIQVEQRYVDRVWEEQKAAGLRPANSGDYGYREWRADVLRACTCGPVSAGCRVHARV